MPYNIGDKLNNKYWSGENYGWQSKATHEKLKEEGKFRLGTQAIDRVVSSGMDWATQNLPGVVGAVNTGLKTVGGVVNFTAEQLNKSATGRAVVSTVGTALETYDQALEAVSEATNIDKRVVGLTTDLAVGAVTGGSGTAAKLSTQAATGVAKTVKRGISLVDDVLPPPTGLAPALAGGVPMPAPQLKPAFQNGVLKLTITEPEFIAPGVKPGIAQTPANVKARGMLDKSIDRLDKRRAQLNADLESGAVKKGTAKFVRLDKKIREERYGEMSSFYNQLDQDPPAYNKALYKNVDPTDITKKAEQHHLAAKAQTAPFIEVMLEVGDPDDLVALHEYSRMLGVVMGNSKRNMLDAPGPIHRAAAARTAKEKAGNIHSAFSVGGMEPNNAYVKRLLQNAKTADDVMRVFKQYADEYLIPQQDIAKKIVQNYLDEYAIKLTPAQQIKFNELASKLSKGS